MIVGEDSGVIVPQPRPLTDGERISPEREPWADHLRKAGLDPAEVEVVPPVEVRTWDAAVGDGQVQTMVYFKAKLVVRGKAVLDDELRQWVRKWRPTKSDPPSGDSTFVVCWADTQIGKDDGDGTKGTVRRWTESHGQVLDRIRALRKQGTEVGRVVVASLGDIVEGCGQHYAQQQWRVEYNERDQRRTARQVIVSGLKHFSDVAPVTVLAVGGNHGEVRQGGKSFTDFADNIDVALFDDAADILAENDRFSHVRFHVPQADLTQTIDLHGTIVGLAHGHQARGGGSVDQKILRWWRGQMEGRQPIGDADILLTGHYHHLQLQQQGSRTWMQAPALDGGSEWFTNVSGLDSPAGVLTFTVSEDGWDNLKVLPATREIAP